MEGFWMLLICFSFISLVTGLLYHTLKTSPLTSNKRNEGIKQQPLEGDVWQRRSASYVYFLDSANFFTIQFKPSDREKNLAFIGIASLFTGVIALGMLMSQALIAMWNFICH